MDQVRCKVVKTVLFPCPEPSYSADSYPGELIFLPRVELPQRRPGPAEAAPPAGRLEQQTNCDTAVPCLFLPYETARFLIIFYHGNADDLGRCRWFCIFLRDQFQVHVLAVEYPGYGACAQLEPTRENVLAHSYTGLLFATQTLRLPLNRIKLFGRSVGTGSALELASRFAVSGLVLVSPFLNIETLFREKVGALANLGEEWFANDEAMKNVRSPTMIIHGQRDSLIPPAHGQALYAMCLARKLFINPANMAHNSNITVNMSDLIIPMYRFFALPDYCFDELVEVPRWAFRKSLPDDKPDWMGMCSPRPTCKRFDAKKVELCEVDDDDDVDRENEDDVPALPPEGTADRLTTLHHFAPTKNKYEFRQIDVVGPPLIQTVVRHDYRPKKCTYDFSDGSPRKLRLRNAGGLEEDINRHGSNGPPLPMPAFSIKDSEPYPTRNFELAL